MRRPLPTLWFALLAGLIVTGGASPGSATEGAGAPRVTRIHILKKAHRLELLAGDEVVATYKVSIGRGGPGPKLREGDRVTPVGHYKVTMHQPSPYKIFLRLDYPNSEDRARFARLQREGKLPKGATIGGDIGIHGPPVALDDTFKAVLLDHDWTAGCVAVGDRDISEIAKRAPNGTPVDIDD